MLEQGIHFTSKRLQKCRRKGLLIALNTVVGEVTMLGFISLMLIAFQENIASICVTKHDPEDRWVILSHIDKCAPCLEDTDTITDTYKAAEQCPFWTKKEKENSEGELKGPEVDIEAEIAGEEGDGGRRLLAGGDTEQGSCGAGEEPLISVQTLHESHIAIFCLAVVHIFNSLLMILIASWKVNVVWGTFEKEENVHDQFVSESISAYDVEHGLLDSKSTSTGVTSVLESGDSSNGQVAIHPSMQTLPEREEVSQDAISPTSQDVEAAPGKPSIAAAARSVMTKPRESRTKSQESQDVRIAEAEGEKNTGAKRLLGSLRDVPKLNKWTARERDMKNPRNWLQETMICFFKQFVKPVSREEYRIMKASFMLTHKRTSRFSFQDYVLKSLDDNFAKIVNFSLSGWLALISFVLLLPPLGWTTWRYLIFQIFAILLLLAVNVKLVAVVRYVTRGATVRQLTPDIFWFKNPCFLVHVIRLMLYLNSVIFATMGVQGRHRMTWAWPAQGSGTPTAPSTALDIIWDNK
eukprot:evm.model.scf_831.2 EVM.evm.TU.scf_831.2   scf_831:22604-28777(+)